MKHATGIGLAALATLVAAPALAGAWGDMCRNLVRLTDISHAIEPGILVATDDLPMHCRVRGVINRAIRFEVRMPIYMDDVSWNGRLMFSTVGGAAGVIGDTTSLLARGYAMASTDTGHEASEGTTFYSQPEALLDYAYRGVHLATLAAKRIVTHFYQEFGELKYSYLQGCSNGGRAAMLEAVRFPDDYDGIIAGAPAFTFQEMIPWMIGAHRAQTANPLTPDALKVLDDASREACDLLDGVEDGVVGEPLQCEMDLAALQCQDGQTENCLTAGQIETARFVYADMVDDAGRVLSPGVPPGAEAGGDWQFWMLPNEQFGGDSVISTIGEMLALLMREDPEFDVDAFDPIRDRDRISDVTSPLDVRSVDLREFRDRGGKLLMYQGWNDYPLRPQRAIDYYDQVRGSYGQAETMDDFFRLFMVPGMLHCAGGPGAWQADYVTPLEAWREKGVAPDSIPAAHPGPTPFAHLAPDERVEQQRRFSRPLCPYPQFAKYLGEGDPDEAASFTCAEPGER